MRKVDYLDIQESRIKTNNIVEDLYKNKEVDNIMASLRDEVQEYKPEIKKKTPNEIDIDNLELTEKDRKELDEKVKSFLGEANKIKEKNNKIIAGEYVEPETEEEKPKEETEKKDEIDEMFSRVFDKT